MRNIFRKIKNLFWDVRRHFKNLRRWHNVLKEDRDFDYAYLLILIGTKLKQMEEFYASGKTLSVGADRVGKEIKVARILIDRILNEDYSSPHIDLKRHIKHINYLKQQDIEYLFNMMRRKILTWWD